VKQSVEKSYDLNDRLGGVRTDCHILLRRPRNDAAAIIRHCEREARSGKQSVEKRVELKFISCRCADRLPRPPSSASPACCGQAMTLLSSVIANARHEAGSNLLKKELR